MNNHIAIIVSRFNEAITKALLTGATSRLREKGVLEKHIHLFTVPGAIEIPFTAQQLAKTKQFAAIICLGAVIRGDTNHYDYVCSQVSEGCQRVMLDESIPVIFGILTTDNEAQAQARVGGSEGHKGCDAADVALEMIAVQHKIKNIFNVSERC